MNRLLPILMVALLGCEREEKAVVATLATVRDVAAKTQSLTLYRVAQPLDPDYQHIEKTAKQKVAGYPVLKQVSLTSAEAAPLVQLLVTRETYFPPEVLHSCGEDLSVAAHELVLFLAPFAGVRCAQPVVIDDRNCAANAL